VDWGNQQADGQGYTLLFVAAALALLAAIPAVYRLDTPPMDTVQLSSRIDAAP
jgi:hypothetical protein